MESKKISTIRHTLWVAAQKEQRDPPMSRHLVRHEPTARRSAGRVDIHLWGEERLCPPGVALSRGLIINSIKLRLGDKELYI